MEVGTTQQYIRKQAILNSKNNEVMGYSKPKFTHFYRHISQKGKTSSIYIMYQDFHVIFKYGTFFEIMSGKEF